MTPRDSGAPGNAVGLRLPDEDEFASATSHPIAAQALKMMLRRPTTASEVAAAMGEPVEEVSRQLADLRRRGLISTDATREVEGRTEPVYEGPFAPFLDREEWEELSSSEQGFQLRQVVNLLMKDIETGLETNTLDAWPHFHLCRMPFRMDEQGWEEIRALFDNALLNSIRIREEATERLQRSGKESRRGTAATLLFELPDAD